MTRVTLFGATGRTGRRVLELLLRGDDEVSVLVRDPARLTVRTDGVRVVVGDVADRRAVDEAVAGAEVVLSLFGHVKGSSPTVQTDGTRNIVAAMQAHGVSRVISLSGGGVPAPGDRPKLADNVIRMLMRMVARTMLSDAVAHVGVLRDSGLDWTVVRAPRLTEAPGTGRFRVGMVGVDASTSISRDDLADFLVAQVTDRRHVHELPFVSA